MANTRRLFSDEEINKITSLRAQGLKQREISKQTGRSISSVNSLLARLSKQGQNKSNRLAVRVQPIDSIQARKKPMIVLIGDHSEITQTIKDLFS